MYWHGSLVAGFKLDKSGRFNKDVEGMLVGLDGGVNSMITRYLRMFDDPDYMTLVSYLEMFNAEVRSGISAMESKDIKVAKDNIRFFKEEIKILTRELFGGDDTRELTRELYKNASDDMLKLRPELISKELVQKQFKPKSPYVDD